MTTTVVRPARTRTTTDTLASADARGPYDPFRDYPLTEEERYALVSLDVEPPSAVECAGHEAVEHRLRVIPGSRGSVEAVSALARLRGQQLSPAERAWAATDPLGGAPDQRLLAEIDAIISAGSREVRTTWAPVPTSLAPTRLRGHLRLARLRRRTT